MSIYVGNKKIAGLIRGEDISHATELHAGIIEIANQEEVNAGIDDLKAVTSLKLETKLKDYKDRIEDLESDVEDFKNNSIKSTAEGESITLNDSADMKFEIFDIYGKSEQNTDEATPSPDFPQEIKTVGENGTINEIIQSKNFLKTDNKNSVSRNGLDISFDENGILNINGTSTAVTYIILSNLQETSTNFTLNYLKTNNYLFNLKRISGTQTGGISFLIRDNPIRWNNYIKYIYSRISN